jgi:hypothetical protein
VDVLGQQTSGDDMLKVKHEHRSRSSADSEVDKFKRKSSKSVIRIPYPDKKVFEITFMRRDEINSTGYSSF